MSENFINAYRNDFFFNCVICPYSLSKRVNISFNSSLKPYIFFVVIRYDLYDLSYYLHIFQLITCITIIYIRWGQLMHDLSMGMACMNDLWLSYHFVLVWLACVIFNLMRLKNFIVIIIHVDKTMKFICGY